MVFDYLLFMTLVPTTTYVFDLMGVLIGSGWRTDVIGALQEEGEFRDHMLGTEPDLDTIITEGLPHVALQEARSPAFDKNALEHKRLRSLVIAGMKYGLGVGQFDPPLEDDVVSTFAALDSQGSNLYLYSSGDTEFLHLMLGKAGGYIQKYFSSVERPEIKDKYAEESYSLIASDLGLAPSKITYVTDDRKEALAAVEAGFGEVWLINREWDGPQGDSEEGYVMINCLSTVVPLVVVP